MNRLPLERRALILNCLTEGMSQRATARIVGVSRNTVSKLAIDAGEAAAEYQDRTFRDLDCEIIEADEIWSFVYARRYTKTTNPEAGDVWTWVALCQETRLIPAWWIGDRTTDTATRFLADLNSRLNSPFQFNTDHLYSYTGAAARFPGRVAHETEPKGVTSHIERLNGTMRLNMRRYNRATYAFSKKLAHHVSSIALFFLHYNFCHKHRTLGMTPAMAEGITDRQWDSLDIAKLLD